MGHAATGARTDTTVLETQGLQAPRSLRVLRTSSHLVATRAAWGQAADRDLTRAAPFAALTETGPHELENGRAGQGVRLAGPDHEPGSSWNVSETLTRGCRVPGTPMCPSPEQSSRSNSLRAEGTEGRVKDTLGTHSATTEWPASSVSGKEKDTHRKPLKVKRHLGGTNETQAGPTGS